MNIIGISAFYHESACCLLQEGRVVAAAAEERFTRIKHDPRLPVRAYRYCLDAATLSPAEVDAVAFYEQPAMKQERQQWVAAAGGDNAALAWPGTTRTERAIRERLGFDGPLFFFEHHLSHAASTFFYSGFEEAAVLTVDGVGEWATTSYGYGHGKSLHLFEQVNFPHSLGLLYATITAYLGFRVNEGEYKVMGLAAYGEPRFLPQLRRLIIPEEGGQFRLDPRYFDYLRGQTMYSPELCALLGRPPRDAEAALDSFHCDIACSLQHLLEETLLEKIAYLATQVPTSNLCLAGGVALNCVANERIRKEGPFEKLFVQPAAGDAGGALGAAALAHIRLTGTWRTQPLREVYLGPAWEPAEIEALLEATGLPARDFRGEKERLLDEVARRLASGQVVGWFQGRMEFGPRALGARSILGTPLDEGMRERVNRLVKKREAFRPFAPSVLLAHAADHFDLRHPSPFMLETCQVRSPLSLPAITHVDGSARPQTVTEAENPRFAQLLERFYERTGCPILLNTSFNLRGEPIVCSPVDALYCMAFAGLDALVMEEWLITSEDLPPTWMDLLPGWEQHVHSLAAHPGTPFGENLYPF